MALQLISPRCTPSEPIQKKKKNNGRKGYKKIRFKAWAPALSNGHDQPQCTRSKPTARGAFSSESVPSEQRKRPGTCLGSNADRIYRCPSPMIMLPINGIRQDPFLPLPIKATGCVPATLDYFIQVVAPDQKDGSVVSGQLDEHMTLLFPFMLQNAALFQSIIALCRGSILISLGQSPSEDKALMYHRSKALRAVTESLGTDDCASDATLLTISMLLTLEYLSGNQAGVSAHMAGLSKLVALRCDLDDSTPWSSFVKRGIAAYKSLGSFVTGIPPEIPKDSRGFIEEAFAELSLDRPPIYPGLPFDPDLCTVLARLPSGFSELCLSGHISTQAMRIVASLTATTRYCEIDFVEDGRIDSELQALLSALQCLSLMKITMMEKYLSCGLVAWSFQLRKLRPLNLFHDPPLRTFVKLIPAQERPDSRREQRCLIWISVAIAGALHLRTIRMPGTHLVFDRIFTLYPVARDWELLVPILKSFYWSDKIGAHWKKCWDEGIKRWWQVQPRKPSKELFAPEVIETPEERPQIEEPGQIAPDDIAAHIRAGPSSMMDAFQAVQCPFLQKAKLNGLPT